MTTPTRRGRAASPVRPGIITKLILQGLIPLETGQHATEAAITDLHGAYKLFLSRINELRPRNARIKGMTMHSYYTMFKFAQLLGLVELVRTEPMLYPPPHGRLYSISKTDRARAIQSKRKVFKLTVTGTEDEKSWTDLTKAWKEEWTSPQKADYFPTIEEMLQPPKPPAPKPEKEVKEHKVKEKKVREKKVKEIPEPVEEIPKPEEVVTKPGKTPVLKPVPVFNWAPRPSATQYRRLRDYLIKLSSFDFTRGDVTKKLDDLGTRIGDWIIELEDSQYNAQEHSRPDAATRFAKEKDAISMVFEALLDHDASRAIAWLKSIVD